MRRARPAAALGVALLIPACVYFNAMYDAGKAYDAGIEAQREGRASEARLQFDSVIAKTGRIVSRHADSKYADDAALLKARSEIHNQLWESALTSTDAALRLASRPADSAVALGLKGIAELALGRSRDADTLLSRALASEIGPDDRATFLFQRGLARLQDGRPAEAATDLETASRQIDLSDAARLQLARALFQIQDYPRSSDMTAELLRLSPYGNLSAGVRAHLDTMIAVAAVDLEPRMADLLADPELAGPQRTLFQLVRGKALERTGDIEGALAMFDSAAAAGAMSRWAPEAALDAALLRCRTADAPEDLQRALPDFQRAVGSSDVPVRERAQPLAEQARRFDALTQAWQSRGASAAEAALRAAELAGTDLESPAVARGLYLKYLELAPDSRWRAKALYGALTWSGHRPGPWVRDEGEATDRRLTEELEALPADDPYRRALSNAPSERWADSAFVLAEAGLRERIVEIQMLYDTTVVRVRRDTAAAAPADTVDAGDVAADSSEVEP